MLYLNFILVVNKVSPSVEIPSWIRYIDNIHTLSENIKCICTSFRNGKKREHLTSLSYLASSAVDHGFEPRSCHTKDNEIGICFFSAKHTEERGKTGWIGIRIMCQSGETCLPADCCFNELAL